MRSSLKAGGRGVNDTEPTISATTAGGPAATARYVHAVDLRIGVTQAPRELTIEMPDDERDEVVKLVEQALAGVTDVLWLTDKRGRRVAIPSAKIAYIEVGTNDGDRRIGFAG
jgi:hypothetical protein